jgi:hypothetical protein
MTTENRLVEEENKSFDVGYIYCDQCELNGIPNQKVIIIYLGIRPVNEPGFIYKFVVYDYSENGIMQAHRHKYDPDVIDHIIDQIFDRTERMVE